MTFVAPTPQTNNPKVADLANQLIVVEPFKYVEVIETVHGNSDAVSCNIINVDTGQTHEDMLFFNVALKGAFRNYIGQQLIGRIIQGVAKTPGKSAPWIFADASTNPADVARGQAAINGGSPTVATPAVASPVVSSGTNGTQITPEIAALLAQLGATAVA